MLVKPESSVDGEPWTSALCNGMGTREEENGVAPAEKGTLGLVVALREPVPKAVTKEPAKKMLLLEELVVIELTRD